MIQVQIIDKRPIYQVNILPPGPVVIRDVDEQSIIDALGYNPTTEIELAQKAIAGTDIHDYTGEAGSTHTYTILPTDAGRTLGFISNLDDVITIEIPDESLIQNQLISIVQQFNGVVKLSGIIDVQFTGGDLGIQQSNTYNLYNNTSILRILKLSENLMLLQDVKKINIRERTWGFSNHRLIAYDSFERPDGLIGFAESGQEWKHSIEPYIIEETEAAAQNDSNTDSLNLAYLELDELSNYTIFCDIVNIRDFLTRTVGVVISYQDSQNYWVAYLDRGRSTIGKVVEGVFTQLAQAGSVAYGEHSLIKDFVFHYRNDTDFFRCGYQATYASYRPDSGEQTHFNLGRQNVGIFTRVTDAKVKNFRVLK